MFYVYMIRNLLNDKLYIGKTNNLEKRWAEHKRHATGKGASYRGYCSYLYAAIAKYGITNFEFSLLEPIETEEESFALEKKYIAELKTDGYTLYNLTDGGEGVSGYVYSPEQCARISERQSGEKGYWFGKTMPEEIRRKKSIAMKGTRCGTDNPMYGKRGDKHPSSKLTWEQVNQIRESLSQGVPGVTLSKQFNVNKTTICDIKRGKTWKKQ